MHKIIEQAEIVRRKRQKSFSVIGVMLLCLGCSPIIYKDAASTYATAARDVIIQVNEAAILVNKGEDAAKLSKIVTDPDCPIGEARLFVRDSKKTPIFSPLLSRFPSLEGSDACQTLLVCENHANGDCRGACFSAEEGNCIVQLEQNYAIELRQSPSTPHRDSDIETAKKQADELSKYLRKIEYGRTEIVSNQLISDNIRVLTTYLDLLGKVVDQQTSDIESDGKRLVDRIDDLTNAYSKITGSQLSTHGQNTRDAIEKYIGVFGKLSADVDALRKNARDAEQIKKIVKNNSSNINEAITTTKNLIKGEQILGVTLGNQSALRIRQDIQRRFQSAPNEYVRTQVFAELEKYPFATSDSSRSKLIAVFDQIEKSHANLVSLVNNPTDGQLRAIRAEQLQNFRTIASDIGKIIALLN